MSSYTEKLRNRQAKAEKDRPAGTIGTVTFIATLLIYQVWAGLWWLPALAAAAATGWTAAMITLGLKETRPLPVPSELADDYAKLSRDGWRKARVHPWWSCQETLPHIHIVHVQDREESTVVWRGRRAWPEGHTL